MRLLGIDYGERRVGIALSDDTKKIAVPLYVLPNDAKLLANTEALIHEHDVDAVVLGASYDYHGRANPIMQHIEAFGAELENMLHLPVHYESEVLTSLQAARHETNRELRDASAAALILQSYLDKQQKK